MATSWKPGTVLSLVSLRLLAILFSSSVYSLYHNTGLAKLSMSFNKHAAATRVKPQGADPFPPSSTCSEDR
jgi:hypothetical protein